MRRRISSYAWLLIGAFVGFLFVVIGGDFFGLQIDGWVGALITTVCAIVSVTLIPGQYVSEEVVVASTTYDGAV
jgi:hypothetical protein